MITPNDYSMEKMIDKSILAQSGPGTYNDDMNLTVILPAYNEIQTIEEILKRVKAVKLATEMIK